MHESCQQGGTWAFRVATVFKATLQKQTEGCLVDAVAQGLLKATATMKR